MRYIFNSAVVTAPGKYDYRHIDIEEARRWIAAGPYQSNIRYKETAAALAFPPGAKPLAVEDKGKISTSYILDHCEIGILRRMPD